MGAVSFEIQSKSHAPATWARAGLLHTPNGDIRTPAFVPVATKASVKGILPGQLKALGAIIASMHNVKFILDLVAGARHAILDGRYEQYRADFVRDYYNGQL